MKGDERDQDKMAALGSLARGFAHEMNTPLASIVSNNDTIETVLSKLRGHSNTAEMKELLSIAEDSVRTNRLALDRLRDFVRSLRDCSRMGGAAREKIDIREPIESALTLLAHELRNRIVVVKDFGEVGPVHCNRTELSQVFINILMNAAQAIQGAGEIRINTSKENNTVRIAISDTGPGIPPDVQARIFTPGFTTKAASTGMGLGMAISLGIVEAHHGTIEIQSEPGKGSTFTVILPLDNDSSASKDSERTANG